MVLGQTRTLSGKEVARAGPREGPFESELFSSAPLLGLEKMKNLSGIKGRDSSVLRQKGRI